MARAFLLILDSFGIGGAPDAASFGDEGSNTLGHICDHMKLNVPHMASLGLGRAAALSTGRDPLGAHPLIGQYGVAREVSRGKDTITGHWEIAGVPLAFEWGYFPHTVPAFPQELIDGIVTGAKLPGLLALCHASGTQVIEDFGAVGRSDSWWQECVYICHFCFTLIYSVKPYVSSDFLVLKIEDGKFKFLRLY